MGGAGPRRKGGNIEREIVARHREIRVRAERYPLSGASRFRGSGHDVDLYIFGNEEAPAVSEVKGRKNGQGFRTLERCEYDLLFLRRDNAPPLCLLPWRTYERLIKRGAA